MILVLILHIFSFLSRAFATMAKSYTSQSYINGKKKRLQYFHTMVKYANYLIFIFMNINENLENKRKIIKKKHHK